MLNYIIRRILLMIPTLVGITIIVFTVMSLAPGGLEGAFLQEEGSMRPEERQAMREYLSRRYGLYKPAWVQYLRWANQISPIGFRVHDDGTLGRPAFKVPDLGESRLRGRKVIDMVAEALPITILLNLITIPIVYSISIVSGIFAARHRGKLFDTASGTIYLGLWSLPVMLVGVLLIGVFANRDIVRLLPTGGLHGTLETSMPFLPHIAGGFQSGWLLDTLWHLVGPVLCLTYGSFAFLSKLMRASVLENLAADFARTARAKGVPERTVLFQHVLRNSLLPLITVAAQILPAMLAGSLIVEVIFSINGMGRLMYEAILVKDAELVLSQTLVIGAISLLSLLIADICYAIADPRVTYE